MAETNVARRVTISGQPFLLRSSDVASALRAVEPEPIQSHFVVIEARRFPPKQVISELTGLDRADFTTHQARRTLMRLGFAAGRRRGAASTSSTGDARAETDARPEGLGERLRPLAGQWVAIKDEDILHAARSPQALVGWLSQHGQNADSVFRVPEDDLAATGLAPL